MQNDTDERGETQYILHLPIVSNKCGRGIPAAMSDVTKQKRKPPWRTEEMDKEEIGKKIDEVLQLEKWRSFVNGKVTGGLAVLEVLGIEKEKRIEVLAKALGLCLFLIHN